MGNCNSICSHIFRPQLCTMESRTLMLGLGDAGKTTLLYKLKLGEAIETTPTIGFNVETINYKDFPMTVWDVAGQEKLRPMWKHYFQNTGTIIFVVDSNDREQIDEAKGELHKLLSNSALRSAVLLVWANKQDLPNAMTAAEVSERLGLHEMKNRRWHIQGTCAISGNGLYESLDWLCEKLGNVRET